MRPGKVSASEEADRLRLARIRCIQNRNAVAEHVPDVKMPSVEHHLDAVRAPAKVAPGQMPEAIPNAFRRNHSLMFNARLPRRLFRKIRQPGGTQQTLRAIPAV